MSSKPVMPLKSRVVTRLRRMPTKEFSSVPELASAIHSTFSPPGATWQEVLAFTTKSAQYGFPVVAVQGCWGEDVKQVLKGRDVCVSVFVGYTLGGSPVESKVVEVRRGVEAGAGMFEYLPNLGYLRSGLFTRFREELAAVVKAADGRPVSAALELPTLSIDERIRGALLAEQAGVACVTNSSGWGTGGAATEEGVRFLRSTLSSKVKVKASGGIRDLETATRLMGAGADLLGTWTGFQIIDELRAKTSADRGRAARVRR